MRGAARRGAGLAAACVIALAAAPVAAETSALVVRELRSPAPKAGRPARLDALLQGLAASPVGVRSLLAPGPVLAVDATADLARALTAARRAPGPRPDHPMNDWMVLRFADAAARDAALAAFAAPGSGLVAEVLGDVQLDTASPYAGVAAAGEIPANVQQIHAPEAWAHIRPDSSIVVAIVDTGADLVHPDLVRRLWTNGDQAGDASPADDATDQNGDGVVEQWERDDDDDNGYVDDVHGYDFTDAPGKGGLGDAAGRDPDPSDEQGHGTHVAGIVAADGSLQGVAPFVRILPVRAAYTTFFGGVLETDDAAAAIVYAVDNGARILNLSWGDSEESRLVREAVDYALAHGTIVVAAAGNGGTDAPHWPSDQPGVLGIGSVDGADQRSSFSNFGPGVALYAPGELHAGQDGGIVSLAPGGGRAALRGTSMAAPHVAGVAAILLSRSDHPDAARVCGLMRAGARHDGSGEALVRGVVDALGAVTSASDLVVQIAGPAVPFRNGRLRLRGTIAGGDVARWRIDARALAGGSALELVPWRTAQVFAGTLVDMPLQAVPEGDWQYVVAVEAGDGSRSEQRGGFTIDFTPPVADTVFAVAAWRGAEPRWWVAATADEPVALRVAVSAADTLEHAGYARRVEIEARASGAVAPSWPATLENPAGLRSGAIVAAPAVLPEWPRGGALALRDESRGFLPEAVWGADPTGRLLLWGEGLVADTLTTVQAWAAEGGRLVRVHDSRRAGRPVGFADTNGDGAADLLVQARSRIAWWTTRDGAGWPDSVLVEVAAERGLGLFQLDDDAAAEALLGSRDTLYIYDDAAGGTPRRLQALPNPTPQGFDVFGATAAVGDLDGDGRIEIACGDAEGRVAVFERRSGRFEVEGGIDTHGVYAYEAATLPGRGLVVGRQRTSDVGGDGFDTAPYDFMLYASVAPGADAARSLSFLAATNDLRAGCVAVTSPASGETWLALVRDAHLYLVAAPLSGMRLAAHFEPAAGVPPALFDLDRDGALDLVLRTPTGAAWLVLDEGMRGPHDLQSESLGAGRLRLSWVPGTGDSSQVVRGLAGTWDVLGSTTGSSWVDSTLAPLVDYDYEIRTVSAATTLGTSNRIRARAQPLPAVLGALPLGQAGLRVRCSNPLGAGALEASRWQVTRVGDGGGIAVVAVTLAAMGREAELVLSDSPGCGDVRVDALDIRDDAGGRIAPPVGGAVARFDCAAPVFAVVEVQAVEGAFSVRFSRAADPATVVPEHVALAWNGEPVEVAAVTLDAPDRARVEPGPGVELVARGIPYRLTLGDAIRALEDGAPLANAATAHAVWIQGRGAAAVLATPNPVRAADPEVVFAETTSSTRIDIFDLEGQRVRELQGGAGGALRWDLRDAAGGRVASGAYIYVVRDPTGRSQGRLVVIH